jgi:hypothetical protein
MQFSHKEIDEILNKTDLSGINTHIGGCTSAVAAIGDVFQNEGYVIPIDEDEQIIHAFIRIDGKLYDSDGIQYKDPSEIVNVVHKYNPFDSKRYQPKHFPLQALRNKQEVDQYLLDNYVSEYEKTEQLPIIPKIRSEVKKRIKETINN